MSHDQEKDRDPEVEALLEKLRRPRPSAQELQRWKDSLGAVRARRLFGMGSMEWARLSAAALAGFILGALLHFRHENPTDSLEESARNVSVAATSERIYDKVD